MGEKERETWRGKRSGKIQGSSSSDEDEEGSQDTDKKKKASIDEKRIAEIHNVVEIAHKEIIQKNTEIEHLQEKMAQYKNECLSAIMVKQDLEENIQNLERTVKEKDVDILKKKVQYDELKEEKESELMSVQKLLE